MCMGVCTDYFLALVRVPLTLSLTLCPDKSINCRFLSSQGNSSATVHSAASFEWGSYCAPFNIYHAVSFDLCSI